MKFSKGLLSILTVILPNLMFSQEVSNYFITDNNNANNAFYTISPIGNNDYLFGGRANQIQHGDLSIVSSFTNKLIFGRNNSNNESIWIKQINSSNNGQLRKIKANNDETAFITGFV